MPRYIDADALLNDITPGKIISSNSVRYKIITAPTADVQEMKHGHWEFRGNEIISYCSICGDSPPLGYEYLYCPNCGAKMDEKEKTR